MTFAQSRFWPAAFALLAAAIIFATPTFAAEASVTTGATQNMNATLFTPDGAGPYPAVLLMHTSGGLQSADLDYAKRLMQEGYVVLVPQFMAAYNITGRTRVDTFTVRAQAVFNDFGAALDQLRANPKVDGGKLAAIGFSNGGYFAVWLAAAGKVRAGISYYGALSGAGSDHEQVRFREVINDRSSPMLILHGSADTTVPISQAAQLDRILTSAKVAHEYVNYDGAGHVFERTSGKENEAAAADAWTRTLAFLKNNLK
jgi:carboxymethylenebutenolidase